MTTIDVKVPDIGDYTDVPVIEVLVADGDTVDKDQPLLVLESDKATMEVPAPQAGTVRGMKVKVGDKLSQGSVICSLEQTGTGKAESGIVETPEEKSPSPPRSGGEGQGEGAVRQEPASSPAGRSPSPPASVGRGSGSTTEVRIPDIGDYTGVPVIEVLVADGDTVDKDQPLIVLESDKATMEVPAPGPGTVRDLKLKVGDKVSEGSVVCALEQTGLGTAEQTSPSPPRSGGEGRGEGAVRQEQPSAPAARPPSPQPSPPSGGRGSEKTEVPYAGPATRKFARELGVDLAQVKGSGPRGRIVIDDVQAFVKQRLAQPAAATAQGGAGIPPIPPVDFAQFGDIETKPLARIRKLSAQYLHRSWVNVPHVTQTDEADVTELEAFRKQQSEELAAAGGPKLTVLPFLMKACAVAMKQYPEFNASLAPDGENLILKKYCHIGFAADTPNGLVVPVVRDVWHKGIAELAAECGALAKKARDGKLKPDEMKGGCFSISSLGGIGGSHFTPIVNAPEVAILGVSKSQMKPVWDGKTFVPRLMCPLSLSYDHRVIDGAYAARFIVHLGRLIGDIRRLSL